MKQLAILLTGFILFFLFPVHAQRVLGYPEVFKKPLDPFDDNTYGSFIKKASTEDKDRKIGWWVVVDRDNVPVYQTENGNPTSKQLKFGSAYYVVEESDNWVKLVDALVNEVRIVRTREEIGWVKKENLLLWNKSLVNPRTKIHLKALLLNKFEEVRNIPCDKQDLVKVYKSPTGNDLMEDLNIYRFYFVYKKEGSRLLLGQLSGLSYVDNSILLGWVDKERVADWNTRVALEPNFTQAGYDERKANPKFRIAGFANAFDAEEFAKGEGNPEVKWTRDPVIPGTDVTKNDPKRFSGGFMRFPLLNIGGGVKNQVLPYFSSAVCDNVALKIQCVDGRAVKVIKVPVEKQVALNEGVEELLKASKRFNVVYVIEGTGAMYGFKESIASSVDAIKSAIIAASGNSDAEKPSVQFGAVIYKDVPEHADSKSPWNSLQTLRMTENMNKVKDFIRTSTYSNPKSNGNYPAQNFGINEAVKLANFKKDETNILIVVGSKGDFAKTDPAMRALYDGKAFSVTNEDLSSALSKKNVGVLALQVVGGKSSSDESFVSNMRSIILETARKQYNGLRQSIQKNTSLRETFTAINYNPVSPQMPDPNASTNPGLFELEHGIVPCGLFKSTSGDMLSSATFNDLVSGLAIKTTKFVVSNAAQIKKWSSSGIGFTGFNPNLADKIADIYEETGMENLQFERYELYTQTYFARKPNGAQYPSFSYVLFWPESDLRNFHSFLERILIEMGDKNSVEKRKMLKEVYCRMLDEFAAEKIKKDCSEYSPDDVIQLINGLYGSGIVLEQKCPVNKPIECLENPRCMSEEEVDTLYRCWFDTKKRLGALLRDYDKDEFAFSRGGEYFFWTKLSDIF